MIFNRRRLLLGTSALAAAGAVGFQAVTRKNKPRDIHLPTTPGHQQYNILLITSDQEQAWSHLPVNFIERHCPGRARLRRQSLSFTRAFTPSPVCSTARACLYSGQHSQQNGLWENIPLPYATPMKKSIPTLGTLMSAAGYHTAYFGKWHLSRLRNRDKSSLPADEVEAEILSYGFDEAGTHQELDGPLGGHLEDTGTTDKVVDFVQRQTKNTKPWFTAVNLLNPHDIMYYTAGAEMTATRKINYPDKLARPPQTGLYSEELGYPLPENFGPGFQSEWTKAATEYALCDDIALGHFPYDDPA
ncbi:MAG: sulfatase-like hydrolase/transferase, partial [Parvibaculaceae bacterium]|nr:sulfatase-like hydrolase/transferase [Parvibaculaceae bacterium]